MSISYAGPHPSLHAPTHSFPTRRSSDLTKCGPTDGQLWLTAWGNGSLDPANTFVPTHRTADRGNSSGYANKELDALLDTANTELDQAKRAEIYHQAEAIVNKDLPMVYLWVAKELYGVSDKVSGWQPKIGRASCRERVCQYVEIRVDAVYLKKQKKPI